MLLQILTMMLMVSICGSKLVSVRSKTKHSAQVRAMKENGHLVSLNNVFKIASYNDNGGLLNLEIMDIKAKVFFFWLNLLRMKIWKSCFNYCYINFTIKLFYKTHSNILDQPVPSWNQGSKIHSRLHVITSIFKALQINI